MKTWEKLAMAAEWALIFLLGGLMGAIVAWQL